MLKKILLAGDGGQGVQTIADILCRAAFSEGLNVSYIPNFGLEQRGGVSLAFVQISDKEISYPKFSSANIKLVLSEQARVRTENYSSDDLVDYKKYNETSNIYLLGIIASKLGGVLKMKSVEKALEEKLINKPGWVENKKIFEMAVSQSAVSSF